MSHCIASSVHRVSSRLSPLTAEEVLMSRLMTTADSR